MNQHYMVPQYSPVSQPEKVSLKTKILNKMRTHDANVELNYLRYRDGGICIGYDWRFLDWGLGFSVFADPNYMPGLWLHLGPLDIGIYKNTER